MAVSARQVCQRRRREPYLEPTLHDDPGLPCLVPASGGGGALLWPRVQDPRVWSLPVTAERPFSGPGSGVPVSGPCQ